MLRVSCLPPRTLSTAAAVVSLLLCAACAADAGRAAAPLLRVGVSGDYAPFAIADTDGSPNGADVEIARRLARDLGFRLELVRFAWAGLLERLRAGSFDVAASGITMRADRALAGRYTRPYALSSAVALIRAADARRFDDAAALNRDGLVLAVNAGGHLEKVARRRFPRARLRAVENATLHARLSSGEVDAVISDSIEARTWPSAEIRVVGPFTSDHKALLLQPGREELAGRIDGWLIEREEDGWLPALRARWLGQSLGATQMAREAVAALVGLRLDLMPAVGAAKRTAGLPIEDREQEERVLDRIRAAAGEDADSTVPVYRLLIEMAKSVQRSTPTAPADASLDALREAIRRVDEQLVRELRRRPRGSAAVWSPILERNLEQPGVDAAARARLAEALAETRGRPRDVGSRARSSERATARRLWKFSENPTGVWHEALHDPPG